MYTFLYFQGKRKRRYFLYGFMIWSDLEELLAIEYTTTTTKRKYYFALGLKLDGNSVIGAHV